MPRQQDDGGRRRKPPERKGGGRRRGGQPSWMTEDPFARVKREQEAMANMAERQMAGDMSRIGGIYEGLQSELAPMAGQYDASAQQIAGQLQSQLGQFSNLLGTGTVPEEAQAAQQVYGGIGAGALGTLASDRQRNLGYQTSTARQAAMEPAVIGRQYNQELRNYLGGLRDQMPVRLDELLDTRFQQDLARREMAMRKRQMREESAANDALSQFIAAQVGSSLTRGGGGGGRRRGGNR